MSSLGWHRRSNLVVNECKLKIVVDAIQHPDSLIGILIAGAIESIQNGHGRSHPALTTSDALETNGHAKKQQEWLWTTREWMGKISSWSSTRYQPYRDGK